MLVVRTEYKSFMIKGISLIRVKASIKFLGNDSIMTLRRCIQLYTRIYHRGDCIAAILPA